VFGKVTGGMDVIEKIGSTRTGPGDKPVTPVQMVKITVHD
jgi:cyclophilin family peptidyl-prolyl cis-trans isomerase